jgi:sugar phosphate isomerase/epimerase
MVEKKKQAISAAVPWQIQEGGKALSLPERIRRTFELGVKNTELSLMSITKETQKPTESLREIPKWLWKMDKEIADEFGGKITVHAPEDIAIEAPSPSGQARAADMIKHSLEVATEMESDIVTVHAAGSPGWALENPLTGTIESLPSHISMPEPLWMKVKKDLEDKEYHTMATRLQTERDVRRNSHMLQWRQNFFMEGNERRAGHRVMEGRMHSYSIANSSLSYDDKKKQLERIKNENPEAVRQLQMTAKNLEMGDFDFTNPNHIQELNNKWWDEVKKFNPEIGETQTLGEFMQKRYNNSLRAWHLCDTKVDILQARDTFFETWKRELDPGVVKQIEGYMKDGGKNIDKMDVGLMDKMFDPLLENVKDTFTILFKDKGAKKMLNKGDIKLCIENIFGPNFKTGATAGYPMGWSPKHMQMILNAVKETAKKNGVDPNSIGMTFDTQHAIVVPEGLDTKPDLDWWFDEFKKRGMKIDHAHLVGGHKGSHETWGHVGLGDMVDEVMREHPDVIDKLAEAGCLNFEAGTRGITDLENSIETTLHGGTPALAMAAEGGYSGGAEILGFTKRPGSFYESAYNTNRASVTRGQFYAFSNPMARSSWQFAMSNTWYGWPGMTTPGAVTPDPQRLQKVWTKYQPY